MKVRVTSRHIWAVSLPVIFAGLSETIVEVTDILFLGRYGTTELAAVGLADAIYSVCLFLTLGLVDGIQIIIARRAGQGRAQEIGAVFNQGVYLLVAVSVLFILLLKGVVPPLAADIIRSSDIAVAVDDFLQIFAFAMFFHGINLALSAFYVGISRTGALIGATIVLAIVNIFLDYALIFGHFGFPELGIRGAAIGSLCAEITAFLYLVLHAVAKRYHRSVSSPSPTPWPWRPSSKRCAGSPSFSSSNSWARKLWPVPTSSMGATPSFSSPWMASPKQHAPW
jgi:Na+-driven multidrug efflux pump